MQNLVIIPFHDFKVALKDGFRTRDTHLYEHFMQNKSIDKLIIINRPTSLAEVILNKKKVISIKKVIYKNNFCYIQQYSQNVFIIDFFVLDFFNIIFKRHAWIPYIYQSNKIVRSIEKALTFLEVKDYAVYCSSPFPIKLIEKLNPKYKVLDAVDNLLKHKQFGYFYQEINDEYKIAKKMFNKIYVNSTDTYLSFDGKQYSKMEILTNGVDYEHFTNKKDLLKDLAAIKKPIIGYAGKMQRMFDVELMKKVALEFPNVNFILLGKILDSAWMQEALDIPNVFHLGDKHYEQLPNYINNFDICFIPYVVENQHGGDPIKFYEFMACNKPIVSTNIGEIKQYENDTIFICDTHEEFIASIRKALDLIDENIVYTLDESMSWKNKANYIINQIKENINA